MARGTVAPKRKNTLSVLDFPSPGASASNQLQMVDRSSIQRTVATPSNNDNLLQMGQNSKGTSLVGRPVVIGQAAKDFALSATENPDGNRNRPGSRRD